MKIISLQAENVKKLKALEIKPVGDVVQISGKNGAGKSSVLDAIYYALAGAKALPKVPVRRGQERATVKVSLGRERVELVVVREFTAGGSVVRVESPEGARFPSPQTMLDALLGELTFDPLEFANGMPADQFSALRALVPLDVDPEKLDGFNRRDYEERTGVNRDAKAKRAQAEGIKVTEGELPALVDTAALLSRMTEASDQNVAVERALANRREAEKEAGRIRDKAEGCREMARQKRADAARLIAEAEGLDVQWVGFDREASAIEEELARTEPPATVDVTAIRTELDQAETSNRAVTEETGRRERRAALVAEAERLEQRSRDLTAAIQARDQEKAAAIGRAAMPVEGLGFGDGIVTLNGLPFDQASSAEQLRVSVAIGMKMNPKLRVLLIKEGSLLDEDNLGLLAEMAREGGYQVWIEKVGTGGKVGIEIAEGEVVRVDGEPVGAPAGA